MIHYRPKLTMKQKLPGKTNILVISSLFHPEVGGAQRYLEELYVNILKKNRNVTVTVLSYNTQKAKEKETYRGMTIYRIPCWNILPGQFALPNPFALITTLIRLTIDKKFSVVHTHLRFFDTTWWAWAYARLIGALSIATEHVASYPIHSSKIVTAVAKLVDRTIATWSLSQYDMITVTNTPAKRFLENTLGIKKPIILSYGGVDSTLFAPKAHLSNHKVLPGGHVVSQKTIVVTYAARLIWSKGIGYFLDAIKELSKKLPRNVIFTLAGVGEYEKRIPSFITKYGLKNRVVWLESLDRKEMAKLLKATDIFVHPSHHTEGFPNSVLEAASSGCFVIATDNAGTNEIISNDQTGMLIAQKRTDDIQRGIMWAVDHKSKRLAIARACRISTRQQYDWGSIASGFYETIQERLYAPRQAYQFELAENVAES